MDPALERLNSEGPSVLGELFSSLRERLERMVEFRLDARLCGRVEPGDVVQEAYIEVARRLDDYLADPRVSFFVWVRQITWQTVIAVQRRHFGEKRTPKREVRLGAAQAETSFSLAQHLIGQWTTPSQAAMREEQVARLRETLNSMDEIDREVLALRHYEHLSNSEVAEVLNLSKTAASNRYVRALTRLGEILSTMKEFEDHQKEG